MNNTHLHNSICYASVVDPKHLWNDIAPVLKPVPTLVLQMTISIFVNHALLLIFQYLRQPRIVSDIITAIVLSPSTLRHVDKKIETMLWPSQSITIIDTLAYLGLLYTMFIQGLHMDLTPITRKTVKTLSSAGFLVILPFIVGCASYIGFWLSNKQKHSIKNVEILTIYWGAIVAVTSFPTLAPILAKHKFLCTDIGREVLSLGTVNDVFAWFLILYILAISSLPPDSNHFVFSPSTFCALFAMLLLVLFCVFVIRPAISKLVGNVAEGQTYSDPTLEAIFFLVLACGLLADAIGSHFIFGAFILGMCIPNGVLATTLIEKMEDCVLGAIMPLYFVAIGIRLDIITLFSNLKYVWLIVMSIFAKPICIIAISIVFKKPISSALALGFLLNAKGLVPLVIIFIGHERGHLTQDSFTALVLIILLSTIIIGPIISSGYKRMRKSNKLYEQKTLEGAKPSDELRLITCIHALQNVPSIINLLELTNITAQTPASISVLHVVEQVGQASAMFIEHSSQDSSPSSTSGLYAKPFFNRLRIHSEQIIRAFHDYEKQHIATSFVKTFTLVSPMDTMYEDICSLVEDKQATLIILPFHKQQGVDGKLEDTNHIFRAANQNVLATSPCSVGLLVDRGLSMLPLCGSRCMAPLNDQGKKKKIQIAMVYIGGPDDREALTYAWRMAGHPFVTLTVIRFVVGNNSVELQPSDYISLDNGVVGNEQGGILSSLTQIEKERQLDDGFVQQFQLRTADDHSICYIERVANNGEEAISLLREIHKDYDLYIVGRGRLVASPLTIGLIEWTDCPELGMMGDVLVTSNFATNSSVLVIQQHSAGVNYNKVYDNHYNDDEEILMGS